MAAEQKVNLERAQDLSREETAQEGNNIGIMIFSPIFLDLSPTEKNEIKALNDRNQHLDALMAEKRCP